MKYIGLLLFFDAPGIKNAQSTAKSTPRRTTQAVFGPAIKKFYIVVGPAIKTFRRKKKNAEYAGKKSKSFAVKIHIFWGGLAYERSVIKSSLIVWRRAIHAGGTSNPM